MQNNHIFLSLSYRCTIDYPASRPIADMDIAFRTISNMYGFVNSTTPFLNVTWFKGDFNFTTQG